MFYRMLGKAVWNGAKALLRYKYGPTRLPRPVLAGLLLAVVGAIVAVVARRESA